MHFGHSLYKINEKIEQTFENKQPMGGINLDIAKECNITWRYNILIKLNLIPCQGRLPSIIINFTGNRKFHVKYNNHPSCKFMQGN